MWATAAPARQQSTAACAISAGLYGTAGFMGFVGPEPTSAAVMMSFSILPVSLLGAGQRPSHCETLATRH
ncbi:MAG: hypothetical protein MUO58_09020 [Anaerolineales bacterium]|nr:hypothetical protein [Anaerolineales bacterium]